MKSSLNRRVSPTLSCSYCPSLAARPRLARGQLCIRNMFTGIVQGMATVENVDRKDNLSQVGIRFPEGKVSDVKIGASVAINGTCLTVTEILGDSLRFDVMVETLRATNLGLLETGMKVNYERSAKVGDEIGGHNVSGHVHVTGEVQSVEDTANNRKLVFHVPDSKWMKYIMAKGYIAVNGCSLTIGEVQDTTFSVYLIPETLRVTVFGSMKVADKVNIEIETQTQAIVDTTERVVASYLAKAQALVPAAVQV
ncbi:hypothetical protein CEUSTIGMA_g6416.t1 [Chlamydomonas eustigma]|uniref:Lumazine-binding domain-containing protein n=1 Tax=Chlamydomonas eustigma TaxID=1157962 RepID=A0A250X7E9_9CHLO|nr:hypothetical protein CEUSTIGMA_g6416.t1 [Chlamydomonas eustigma]|eukprot:GAX78976.1 hypothetical protein CEUSTIGMA_g6416.t1 [Chlamydomonas eustigma]